MGKYSRAFSDGFETFSDPFGLIAGYITKSHCYSGFHADRFSGEGHFLIKDEVELERPITRGYTEQILKAAGDLTGLAMWVAFTPLIVAKAFEGMQRRESEKMKIEMNRLVVDGLSK